MNAILFKMLNKSLSHLRWFSILAALALALSACGGSGGGGGGGGGGRGTDGGGNQGNPSVVVTQATIPPGSTCANGGIQVDSGIDDNLNGVLDPSEVDDTQYVCNGAPGAEALVKLSQEVPGGNCAGGGVKVESGLDADGDGVLDAEEVTETQYWCQSASLSALISTDTVGGTLINGNPINFYGNGAGGVGPYTFQWNFDSTNVGGGPAPTSVQNPANVTFPSAGNYIVQLTVTDIGGAMASTTLDVEVAAGTIPSAPAGVTGTGGTGDVALTWTPVTGATSYTVFWGTAPGVTTASLNKAEGLTTPSYDHLGLTNGSPRYYIVTASNAQGVSAASLEASATPMASPSSFTATAGPANVVLAWGTVAGASGYSIYRSTTNGFTPGESNRIATNILDGGYTDTAFTPDVPNYYAVTSTNANGESDPTVQNTVTPFTWVDIAAGAVHTLALGSNGTLWSWGRNDSGQLGDGTTTDTNAPQQVGTGADWGAIAAGDLFSLAIRTNGTLWAWGKNTSSQLGDGTTTQRTTPVPIGSATNNWVAITAGSVHSLGIRADGTLWGWGTNASSVLGEPTAGSPQTTPLQVGTATTWASVSTGDSHTLATRTDGTLWAWGSRSAGRLGDGLTTPTQTTPIQIGSVTTWAMVAASVSHSLGVRSDGTLWAWGDNTNGQVGDPGASNPQTTPRQIGTATNWATVSTTPSATFSLATRSDGTLWAWGINSSGQQGDGTLAQHNSPIQIGPTSTWLFADCGASHAVALRDDGTVWATGSNSNGQLGLGISPNQSSALVEVGGSRVWVDLEAGQFHTLALRNDGTLWAWGGNTEGRLGDGTTTNRNSAVQIGTGTNWVAVSGGWQHSLGVRSDGTLWGWGYNLYGQVGDSSTIDRSSPVQVGTASNWAVVSAGQFHSLAVKSDGTLWAWGRNDQGQLGDGTAVTNRIAPFRIGTDSDWVSVAAGQSHSLGLRSDGTLWAWGLDSSGQLGDGAPTGPQNAPVQVGTATDWEFVAAGDSHSLAIKSDGTLWAWGLDSNGQLGDGATTGPQTAPVQVGAATDWAFVVGGGNHSLGVKTGGTLWGWGASPANGTGVSQNAPAQVGSATDWFVVAGGTVFSVGTRTTGQIWAWGSGSSGSLGDGTDSASRTSPWQLP